MKLLFVNSCISQRGEVSRTLALAKAPSSRGGGGDRGAGGAAGAEAL